MEGDEGSGTRKEAEKQLKREGIDIRKLNVVANMENTEVIKQSVKKRNWCNNHFKACSSGGFEMGECSGISAGRKKEGSKIVCRI